MGPPISGAVLVMWLMEQAVNFPDLEPSGPDMFQGEYSSDNGADKLLDIPRGRRASHWCLPRKASGLADVPGQLDPEGAAAAMITFKADGAAHGHDDLLADGQANASAADAPALGTQSVKRFEQVFLALRRDAAAGVCDRDAEQCGGLA